MAKARKRSTKRSTRQPAALSASGQRSVDMVRALKALDRAESAVVAHDKKRARLERKAIGARLELAKLLDAVSTATLNRIADAQVTV